MKKLFKRSSLVVLFLLAGFVLLSSANAIAASPPYLVFGGNYAYDADSKELTFSDNYAEMVQYTDEEYGWDDPILYAPLSFGTLKNSGTNNLVFGPDPGGSTGPVDFSIDGFITAKLNNFIVADSALMWGNLYDIRTVEGAPSSRYVDELLSNGGGAGLININFTPQAGGTEYFTASSSGAAGGIVAAPEPVSAILFITGAMTLALRRSRQKRI